MSHRSLADERWYSTPALLRLIRTYPAGVTDAMLRQTIAWLSKRIDKITDQSFWPLTVTFVRRGRCGYDVYHPQQLPILNITLVEEEFSREMAPYYPYDPILGQNSGWSTLPNAFWEVGGRSVYLSDRFFGQGFLNLKVSGVFGWVENSRGLVTTTTTVDVKTNDTTITVADASTFFARDVIDLAGPTGSTPLRAIIESVNYTTNKFTVDVVSDPITVPLGSTVSTWGQVPSEIERVLAVWSYNILLAQLGLSSPIPVGRLKKESTDSYFYELYGPSENAYTGDVTGDPLMDSILDSFTAPANAGIV